METFLSLIEPFLWLALALPAVTDDFFTNLALMLVVPVIVVVGGSPMRLRSTSFSIGLSQN